MAVKIPRTADKHLTHGDIVGRFNLGRKLENDFGQTHPFLFFS